MCLEEVLSNYDSEDDVDDEVADIEERVVCTKMWSSILILYMSILVASFIKQQNSYGALYLFSL